MAKKQEPLDDGMEQEGMPSVVQVDDQYEGAEEQAATQASDIPSRNEIIRALGRIPGLVALKMLAPAQANAICGVYKTMLGEESKSRAGQKTQISDDNVLKMLREQPGMLSLLEPLLTNEQIEMVMKDASDDDQPET